jgi:hypothetical protein
MKLNWGLAMVDSDDGSIPMLRLCDYHLALRTVPKAAAYNFAYGLRRAIRKLLAAERKKGKPRT